PVGDLRAGQANDSPGKLSLSGITRRVEQRRKQHHLVGVAAPTIEQRAERPLIAAVEGFEFDVVVYIFEYQVRIALESGRQSDDRRWLRRTRSTAAGRRRGKLR